MSLPHTPMTNKTYSLSADITQECSAEGVTLTDEWTGESIFLTYEELTNAIANINECHGFDDPDLEDY